MKTWIVWKWYNFNRCRTNFFTALFKSTQVGLIKSRRFRRKMIHLLGLIPEFFWLNKWTSFEAISGLCGAWRRTSKFKAEYQLFVRFILSLQALSCTRVDPQLSWGCGDDSCQLRESVYDYKHQKLPLVTFVKVHHGKLQRSAIRAHFCVVADQTRFLP